MFSNIWPHLYPCRYQASLEYLLTENLVAALENDTIWKLSLSILMYTHVKLLYFTRIV